MANKSVQILTAFERSVRLRHRAESSIHCCLLSKIMPIEWLYVSGQCYARSFIDGDCLSCTTSHKLYMHSSLTKLHSFRNTLAGKMLGWFDTSLSLTHLVCNASDREIMIHYYFICLNWSLKPPGAVQLSMQCTCQFCRLWRKLKSWNSEC